MPNMSLIGDREASVQISTFGHIWSFSVFFLPSASRPNVYEINVTLFAVAADYVECGSPQPEFTQVFSARRELQRCRLDR